MKNLIQSLLIIFIFFVETLNAATYYVSTTGNDSNPGTSSQPFRTLDKAESTVIAGDMVMINDGTYNYGSPITRNGNSGSQIIFKAVNSGNVTITSALTINANYRTFDGFVFNSVVADAVLLLAGSNNTISNTSFTITGNKAIWVKGGSNLLQNVKVSTSATSGYGILVGDDSGSAPASSNNTLDGVTVSGTNTGTIHGILISGNSGNTLKNSYISNTYYGLVDKMTNGTKVYNNVFNNTASSIYASIYGKGATGGQYCNNIIRHTSGGTGIIIADNQVSILSAGIVIKNNIFVVGSNTAIFNSSSAFGTNTFSSDYNLYNSSGGLVGINGGANYSTLSAWQGTGVDTHSILATPLFTNASGKLSVITDFKPVSGSSAINVGTTVSWRTTDASGLAINGTPDIGVYEYQAAQVVPTASGNVYYVATNGNDANSGTIDKPFKTLQKISTLTLNPGDIVYIRAGTYMSGSTGNSPQYSWLINGKNGNGSNPITIAAYPGDFPSGGRVVFDCSDFSYTSNHIGIYIQNSSYLLIKGIRVTGIPQRQAGQVCVGWWVTGNSGGNITLENCEADHIGNTGFRLDNTNNMTYLNCDAHHIDNPYDPGVQKHGGSDGFGRYDPSNTSQNTVYRGCRAWFCSDDGWDSFGTSGLITFENCWAFWSGYVQDVFPLTHRQAGVEWGDGNGIKLGSNTASKDHATTHRIVRNCFSFQNYQNGFDQNLYDAKMEFYNNTSYANGKAGFFIYTKSPMIARNNLSYANATFSPGGHNFQAGSTTQSNNSWNGFTTTNADFASTSVTGSDGARQADGSLPVLNFMHLASGSHLINAGTNVGLSFLGGAPDLGAFEYGGSASTTNTTNRPPVANAGADQTISLPTSSLTLTGSGTDADGSISAYLWTKLSGPTQYTISSATLATSGVSALTQGAYLFELKVTDNSGAVGKDTVKVTVTSTNLLPIANAGANQTITLPTNWVILNGSASSDPDGSIVSYKWVKLSSGAGTISNTAAVRPTINGLVEGQYTFELTVTDNKGATAKAQMKVTVYYSGARTVPGMQDTAAANQPWPAGINSFVQLNLYPNPASDLINVEISNDRIGAVSLNIYDLNGRVVKKMELSKQLIGSEVIQQVDRRDVNGVQVNSVQAHFTLPVNISSLGRGVYILETIIDKKTRVTSKFVKY